MVNGVKVSFNSKVLLVGLAAFLISSCSTPPTKEGFQKSAIKGFDVTAGAVKGGFNRIKSFSPGGEGSSEPSRREDFSNYPADQIPHTLMTKPVGEGRLTSGHGYRFSPTGLPLPKKHRGIDYGAPTGTPIFAAGSGVIDKLYVSSSYGNYIRIKHANGFSTAYAHMDEFASGLENGSQVTRGQRIGNVGSTGRSSGPHLHYELLHNGRFVDPLFSLTTEQQKSLN